MSDDLRHEELEMLVAAWVLGALDSADEESIRTHVEACPTCREVAARLRRVVGALPLVVEEVSPPARLRERVLAAAAASRGGAPAIAAVPRARPRVPSARPAIAGFARRMPLYAMAAVALVALLLGVLVGQTVSRNPAVSPVARYTLAGHGEMASAKATVVDLREDGVALVDFRGLPDPGDGRVYQIWLIPAKGAPVGAAVFVPDSNGAKVVLVNESLSGYTTMAVTNEPAPDGSPAPTQQPNLLGSLA